MKPVYCAMCSKEIRGGDIWKLAETKELLCAHCYDAITDDIQKDKEKSNK